jgi:nucleoid-associated protein YgaU
MEAESFWGMEAADVSAARTASAPLADVRMAAPEAIDPAASAGPAAKDGAKASTAAACAGGGEGNTARGLSADLRYRPEATSLANRPKRSTSKRILRAGRAKPGLRLG